MISVQAKDQKAILKRMIHTDNLEDLMDAAGEAKEMPPPPRGGIPKQTVPPWIRWPIRLLFLPFVVVDVWAQRVAKLVIRPPHRQVGKCHQRGNCCHYILLQDYKGWKGALNIFWNTQINGFFLRDSQVYECQGKRVFVMGCRYLQKNGRCGRYFWRPAICRKWPLIEYFGHPSLLKGCGFRAIAANQKEEKPEGESPLKILK
jgi:Fe-S-cluster containining protein